MTTRNIFCTYKKIFKINGTNKGDFLVDQSGYLTSNDLLSIKRKFQLSYKLFLMPTAQSTTRFMTLFLRYGQCALLKLMRNKNHNPGQLDTSKATFNSLTNGESTLILTAFESKHFILFVPYQTILFYVNSTPVSSLLNYFWASFSFLKRLLRCDWVFLLLYKN